MYIPFITDMLWYAVAWSCCNEFCFICEFSFSLAAEQNQFFINLIKTWECFTDHHPRRVSRVAIITCIMLGVWFTPKHQIPYGTVLASAASKMLLWDLVAEKPPSGSQCTFTSLVRGFFFLQERIPAHLYHSQVMHRCRGRHGQRWSVPQRRGGSPSTPTTGTQWRAKQQRQAGRCCSGSGKKIAGSDPSYQLLPTDLLRNQRLVKLYRVKHGRKNSFL